MTHLKQGINKLHDDAMVLCDQAMEARRHGLATKAIRIFRVALGWEKIAAMSASIEPTRSVLFRSAAEIALDCQDPAEASRLARMGFDGNPPPEIVEELLDVLKRAETTKAKTP